MATVQLTGSHKTFYSISLVQLLRRDMGLGLSEAKARVDALLTGSTVAFRFATTAAARAFFDEAERLGAIGAILDE